MYICTCTLHLHCVLVSMYRYNVLYIIFTCVYVHVYANTCIYVHVQYTYIYLCTILLLCVSPNKLLIVLTSLTSICNLYFYLYQLCTGRDYLVCVYHSIVMQYPSLSSGHCIPLLVIVISHWSVYPPY